jgi:hypothetical protein
VITIFFFVVSSGANESSKALVQPNGSQLFASDDIIAIRLEAPFSELFAKKAGGLFEAKKTWVDGKIYAGDHEIAVRLRMRGYSSLGILCSFPKLMLKFDKEASKGTVFEGVNKVDLGTHCLDEKEAKEKKKFEGLRFPHREALLYQWAKVLEVPTYAARSATVTYTDSSRINPMPSLTRPAFFLEHLSSLKKRAQAIEIRPVNDSLHPFEDLTAKDAPKLVWKSPEESTALSRDQLARVAFFESLIGNGDWRMSSTELWNVKVLELPSGEWITIPMDFNFSSIALGVPVGETNWAHGAFAFWPAASKEVRLRIIEDFEAKKSALFETVESLKIDDPDGYKKAKESLASKFETFAKMKNE